MIFFLTKRTTDLRIRSRIRLKECPQIKSKSNNRAYQEIFSIFSLKKCYRQNLQLFKDIKLESKASIFYLN
jgi:hypothetical protein